MNTQTQLIMKNFDKSINSLCKRKLELMREIKEINESIEFLQQQQENCK
jgi:prefoldin subunit 5